MSNAARDTLPDLMDADEDWDDITKVDPSHIPKDVDVLSEVRRAARAREALVASTKKNILEPVNNNADNSSGEILQSGSSGTG